MVTILDYNEFKKKALSNPKVKAEYDSLESEFALFDEMLKAMLWVIERVSRLKCFVFIKYLLLDNFNNA